MTQIDQFESIFRAASKNPFEYSDWQVNRVLIVGDGTDEETENIEKRLQEFLSHAFDLDSVEWIQLSGDGFNNVKQLIESVEKHAPDLICCRRNLHVQADEYSYSLGVYVEVLTQVTNVPVLLLPTESEDSGPQWHRESKTVVAITDHLDADAMIVNSAIKLTSKGGKLFLAHVEDERAFQRYMHVIEKIAEIDSETAVEKVRERLLMEPQDFIESCRAKIGELNLDIEVLPVVKMGHNLTDYKEIVDTHRADLVVIHSKDQDQLAMHGVAYPLTIELHRTPMLLI